MNQAKKDHYLSILQDIRADASEASICAKHSLTVPQLGARKAWLKRLGWVCDKAKKTFAKAEARGLSRFRSNSPAKQAIREWIAEHVSRRIKGIRHAVLCLPGETAEIERLIRLRHPKAPLVAVERLPKVYARMVARFAELGLAERTTFLPKELKTVLGESCPGEYSGIVLDFCGTLAKSYAMLYECLANDMVVRGGRVALTLIRRSGCVKDSDDYRWLESMAKICPSALRKKFPGLTTESLFGYLSGFKGYKLVGAREYRNPPYPGSAQAANMITVILKRK